MPAPYGVVPEGFNRKRLDEILADLQAGVNTVFPGVNQADQSPHGQFNGLMADAISDLWEMAEDVFHSYDVYQAEGNQLDTIGILLDTARGGDTDEDYRRRLLAAASPIVGQGIAVTRIKSALDALPGVVSSRIYLNTSPDCLMFGDIPMGNLAIVIDGFDSGICTILEQLIPAGVITFGGSSCSSSECVFTETARYTQAVQVEVFIAVTLKPHTRCKCPVNDVTAARQQVYDYIQAELITCAWGVGGLLHAQDISGAGLFPGHDVLVTIDRVAGTDCDRAALRWYESAGIVLDNITIVTNGFC